MDTVDDINMSGGGGFDIDEGNLLTKRIMEALERNNDRRVEFYKYVNVLQKYKGESGKAGDFFDNISEIAVLENWNEREIKLVIPFFLEDNAKRLFTKIKEDHLINIRQ